MSVRIPLAILAILALLALAPAASAQTADEGEQTLEWTTGLLGLSGEEVMPPPLPDAPVDPVVTVAGVTLLGPPPSRSPPAHSEASSQNDRSGTGAEIVPGGLFGDLPKVTRVLPDVLPDLGILADAPVDLDALPIFRDQAAAPAMVPASASTPGSFAPASAAPSEDAPDRASSTLIALASAAAIASVAVSPAFDWERVRRFGFLAVLYTRIAKDRLLDHGRRESLLSVIRDRPGMTLGDIAETSGIPRNTATYHLNRLEKEGILTSARQGRSRLYFVVGGAARKSQAEAFAALRHENARALALAVGDAPGVDQQALCARLGLTPSLVHWHADRLLAAGVLRKEREGRHVRYHPGEAYPLLAASETAPQPTSALPC